MKKQKATLHILKISNSESKTNPVHKYYDYRIYLFFALQRVSWINIRGKYSFITNKVSSSQYLTGKHTTS